LTFFDFFEMVDIGIAFSVFEKSKLWFPLSQKWGDLRGYYFSSLVWPWLLQLGQRAVM